MYPSPGIQVTYAYDDTLFHNIILLFPPHLYIIA